MFWLPPGRYYVGVVIQDQATAVHLVLNTDGDNSTTMQGGRQIGRAVLNRAPTGAGAGEDEAARCYVLSGDHRPDRAILLDLRAGN
jgi:hypothetical protein